MQKSCNKQHTFALIWRKDERARPPLAVKNENF